MAEDDKDQKTEEPTSKRLNEAMERGQVARAPELQVLFTLAAVLAVLAFSARTASQRLAEYAISIFSTYPSLSVHKEAMAGEFAKALVVMGPILLPILLACAAAALFSGGVQSGFHIASKALGFHWDRVNPKSGFERQFSKDIFVRFGLDLLKVIAIGATLYAGARNLLRDPLFTSPIETAYLGVFLNRATIEFFGRMLMALSVVAGLSYAHQKLKTMKDLRMTRQEVKDEMRGAETDAKIKAAQRRLGRRLMQKQMLAAVATADVVVTNPTHYAVALKYERGTDAAPVILAKGENRFALRLREIAAEHGVPVVENKTVARLLFALGRVGESIPSELYQATAEILAMVYRTHRYYFHRLRGRRLETPS
jgi:flagellar biosynthetic protein FlhB